MGGIPSVLTISAIPKTAPTVEPKIAYFIPLPGDCGAGIFGCIQVETVPVGTIDPRYFEAVIKPHMQAACSSGQPLVFPGPEICAAWFSGMSGQQFAASLLGLAIGVAGGAVCLVPAVTGVGAVATVGCMAGVGTLAGSTVRGLDGREDTALLDLDAIIVDAAFGGVAGGATVVIRGRLANAAIKSNADDALEGAALRACASFSGATLVLMANGTRKAIADVREGDLVLATDPETGESGSREVVATLPHTDQLLALNTSAGDIITTEDHRYWNQTDQAWQESQHLDEGDRLLTADGDQATIEGLDWTTIHTDAAYDLDIAGIDTFYVGVDDESVLVHNANYCGVPDESDLGQILNRSARSTTDWDDLVTRLDN